MAVLDRLSDGRSRGEISEGGVLRVLEKTCILSLKSGKLPQF